MSAKMLSVPVKSKSTVSSKKTKELTISLETLQPIIKGLFVGQNKIFTAEELALIYGKESARAVYHYGTGQVRLSLPQFVTLVRESIRRGNYDLIELMIPHDVSLLPDDDFEPNGECDDELGDLTEHAGHMRAAFKQGKPKTAKFFAFQMTKDAVHVTKEAAVL